MPDLNLVYRDQLVRAVLGTRPAILAKEADITALARFCQRLADAEEAIRLLCGAGYGTPSESLTDLVRNALQRSQE